MAKNGRYGPYVTEVLPEDAPKSAKPRTGSLFKSMSLDTVTLERRGQAAVACRAWSAPTRTASEITAQNGRYGPYLKKGTDSRSLTSRGPAPHDHPRRGAGDLRPAQAARPGGGRAAPLKELGNDPVSGQPVVVKAGRFGEYVTDGEYNATLRKDDSVEAITLERAAELLAERRAKGPAKKTAKKGAKKAPPRRPPRRRPPRRRPRRPRPRSPDRALVGARRHAVWSPTACFRRQGVRFVTIRGLWMGAGVSPGGVRPCRPMCWTHT